ncbi:MAG TPA: hypothetical protein VGB20_00965 [bacterium]
MTRTIRRLACVVAALPALWLAAPGAAWAAISVNSVRGGRTIDLGTVTSQRGGAYDEVVLGLSVSPASQYRLTQFLSRPLINESGVQLDSSALMLEVSEGRSGTIGFGGAVPAGPSELELYVSNPSGSADALRIIYSVSGADVPEAGTYQGALTYTLQTQDGASVDAVTMPIRLVMTPEARLEFAPDSPGQIRLSGLEPGEVSESAGLSIEVSSNVSGDIDITQSVDGPLINDEGRELPFSAVEVESVAGGARTAQGLLASRMIVLPAGRTSASRVEVTYRVRVPETQPAGVYRGVARFELGGSSAGAALAAPIEIQVLPVMELSVRPAEAGGRLALAFSNLTPGEDSEPQELVLEIRSNLGAPYEIAQEFSQPLTSLEGRQLPEDALTFVAVDVSGAGAPPRQASPVRAGRSSVYRSDDAGAPARLTMRYRIRIPPNAAAGEYQSSLLFTVIPF